MDAGNIVGDVHAIELEQEWQRNGLEESDETSDGEQIAGRRQMGEDRNRAEQQRRNYREYERDTSQFRAVAQLARQARLAGSADEPPERERQEQRNEERYEKLCFHCPRPPAVYHFLHIAARQVQKSPGKFPHVRAIMQRF